MGKEITRDEAIALRAAAQVVVQLADQLLHKMDAPVAKRKSKSIVTQEYLARQNAQREKVILRGALRTQAQKSR